MGRQQKTLREQVESHSTPLPWTSCVIWVGATNPWGYGNIRHRGRTVPAHRASYMVHKGEIPAGMSVCHTCDVPACVNPDHLYLGTPKENAEDMVAKGRSARGSKSGKAKWDDSTVRAIVEAPGTAEQIAARFGCGSSIVGYYKAGLGRAAQFVKEV